MDTTTPAMPAAPLWSQALSRYPFATALLPGWRDATAELPEAYSAALDAALAAFDPERPLTERYQQLLASRAQLAELAAAGDQHIATQLLRLRVLSAFGEPQAARQLSTKLLEQRERAAQAISTQGEGMDGQQDELQYQQAAALRGRLFLPSCTQFDDCPPTDKNRSNREQVEPSDADQGAGTEQDANGSISDRDLDAWLSAMLLETYVHLSAEHRHARPQGELARLAQRRKLSCVSIESERMLALTALRLGKKITIKPGSRLRAEGKNPHLWAMLGENRTAPPSVKANKAPEPPTTTGGFVWPLPTEPVVVLDNSAALLCEPEQARLLADSPLHLIAFDPARRVSEPEQYQVRIDRELHPGVLLGDGQPAILYRCADPSYSATLPPLPEAQGSAELRKALHCTEREAVATLGWDQLGGFERLDWLRLDAQSDTLSILAQGTQTLRHSLLLDIQVVFQPTHAGQTDLGALSHWASAQGFRFYCLHQPKHRSPLLVDCDTGLRQSSELVTAHALFIPERQSLAGLSRKQIIKCAFLVHQFYHLRDLAYALLAEIDEALAVQYLQAEGERKQPIAVKKNSQSIQWRVYPDFVQFLGPDDNLLDIIFSQLNCRKALRS